MLAFCASVGGGVPAPQPGHGQDRVPNHPEQHMHGKVAHHTGEAFVGSGAAEVEGVVVVRPRDCPAAPVDVAGGGFFEGDVLAGAVEVGTAVAAVDEETIGACH